MRVQPIIAALILVVGSLDAGAQVASPPSKAASASHPSARFALADSERKAALVSARKANIKPLGTTGNICYIGPCSDGLRVECVYDDEGACTDCYETESPVCGDASLARKRVLKPYQAKK